MDTANSEQLGRASAVASTAAAPADWPAECRTVVERAVTVDYASLTASGVPIAVPVTPYLPADGATIDVSTGLTYPAKAERARRNPKVALLFGDSLGSGPEAPAVVLVQGLATVRDADVQTNTDRYVRAAMEKLPEAYAGQPRWLLRRQAWYFARIWICVTPVRILWWPGGRLEDSPQEWIAPAGTRAPASDPWPGPAGPRPRADAPSDWRGEATAAATYPMHDLTIVDPAGFPLMAPVKALEPTPSGFRFRIPAGVEVPAGGPACLTAHSHDVPFTSQQNRTFVGRLISSDAGSAEIEVQRLLPHWSIPEGKVKGAINFIRAGRRLRPLLLGESARRGQQAPEVRLPDRS